MRKLLTAVLFLSVVSTSAFAVDLTMTYKDPETGKLIPDVLAQDAKTAKCEGQEGGPCLTLGAVLVHSLLRPHPDDASSTDPAKKEAPYLRGAIAYRVLGKKALNLNPGDLPMIKEAVNRIYSPAIVVMTFRAIDPSLKEPDEVEPKK
jgi:hypothetical protein